MKKIICCVLSLLIVISFAACENEQTPETENKKSPAVSDNETSSKNDVNQNASDEIDVDLTKLSSIMMYSEVNNIIVTPENYIGKTVKISGSFSIYQDEQTGKIYYACLLTDAASCCSQGLEFVLKETRSYPDEYPETGTDITVTGVFETYMENGKQYCQLVDSILS